MRDNRNHQRQGLAATAIALLAALPIPVAGCVAVPEKRPVEDLYREALAASRARKDPADDAARSAASAGARTAPPRQPPADPFGDDARGTTSTALVSDVFAGTLTFTLTSK